MYTLILQIRERNWTSPVTAPKSVCVMWRKGYFSQPRKLPRVRHQKLSVSSSEYRSVRLASNQK